MPAQVENETEEVLQKVESAYVPSDISPAGSIKSVVLYGILGVMGGIVGYTIGVLLVPAVVSSVSPSDLYASIMGIALLGLSGLYLMVLFPGQAVGWMSDAGARASKSRNVSQVSRIAAIIALCGISLPQIALFSAFGKLVTLVLPEPSRYTTAHSVRLVLTVLSVLLSPVIAYSQARKQVESQRFCEVCQQYMRRSLLSIFPLEATGQVKLCLSSWDLPKLSAMKRIPRSALGSVRGCEMKLWTCGCRQTNYLELIANGEVDSRNYNHILVFSANISPEHVNMLEAALNVKAA